MNYNITDRTFYFLGTINLFRQPLILPDLKYLVAVVIKLYTYLVKL